MPEEWIRLGTEGVSSPMEGYYIPECLALSQQVFSVVSTYFKPLKKSKSLNRGQIRKAFSRRAQSLVTELSIRYPSSRRVPAIVEVVEIEFGVESSI